MVIFLYIVFGVLFIFFLSWSLNFFFFSEFFLRIICFRLMFLFWKGVRFVDSDNNFSKVFDELCNERFGSKMKKYKLDGGKDRKSYNCLVIYY